MEIFAAGDGINYPSGGKIVSVHYTGYVRRRHRRVFKYKNYYSCPMVINSTRRMIEENRLNSNVQILKNYDEVEIQWFINK